MSQTLKSSLGTATQHATSLKNAGDTILQAKKATLDSQTTLAGNAKAVEAIDAASQSAIDVAQAVNGACANIQTVASNFEAVDQEASRSFSIPLLGE